jgi:hypothetical protein
MRQNIRVSDSFRLQTGQQRRPPPGRAGTAVSVMWGAWGAILSRAPTFMNPITLSSERYGGSTYVTKRTQPRSHA